MFRRCRFGATAFRSLAIVPLAAVLVGCAVPPPMQILSLALNGISFVTSGKSAADHGISAVVQKDCSMIRVIRSENICHERSTSPANASAAGVPRARTYDPVIAALGPIQVRQIVEVSRPAGVIAPQGLFADRRRPLIQVVATGFNDLALLYQRQGKYIEAESLLERALAIRERAFGSEYPEVATTLDHYTRLLRATGRAENR